MHGNFYKTMHLLLQCLNHLFPAFHGNFKTGTLTWFSGYIA